METESHSHNPTVVYTPTESQAREDLINFIQHEASLDDIARLYSMLIVSGQVEIASGGGIYSFIYRNGRKVKGREERRR